MNEKNIRLKILEEKETVEINANEENKISVKPILVPHRQEYSETVAYHISHKNNFFSAIFCPDIDTLNSDKSQVLIDHILFSHHVFFDGTFYSSNEISSLRDFKFFFFFF